MAPVPTITVGGFRAWVEDAANRRKAQQLKPCHRSGLDRVKNLSLAPLLANMLSSETFVRVARSPHFVDSHGHETCALNQLREVHGLPRLSASQCRAQKQQPRRPPTQRQQQETTDVDVSTVPIRKQAIALASGNAKQNAGRVATRPVLTAHRTVSAPTPVLQPTPVAYEQDAVLAFASGEGSEDPFWLAVVSQRTSTARANIPVLWLERDARFSARGEIFWCGQHGKVGTAYVACQVRQYWKPKQIGGWSKDSAFVCSPEEVQLVRAHLKAAAAKSVDTDVAGDTSPGAGSVEPSAKRRRRDINDQSEQVSDQACPRCVANCGKKIGHSGPHRRKSSADAAGANGNDKERISPKNQHAATSTASRSATSSAEKMGTRSRSGRCTAGIARRIFDPSFLGAAGQRP